MCRYLYNWSLAERIASYQLRKHSNLIEKAIRPKGKKEILSSCMGQIFYQKGNDDIAINILTKIEGIFGIYFSSVWERIPGNINYHDQAGKLPAMKKERLWFTFH